MPIVFTKPVLPPVWDLSGCTFVSSYSLTGVAERPMGIDWNNDGTKAYIVSDQNDSVEQFSLSTPYDFVTGSVTHDVGEELDVSGQSISPQGGAFSSDGQFYYMIAITGTTSRTVYQYDLTIDWDISSGVYNTTFYIVNNAIDGAPTNDLVSPTGLTFSQNGDRMYVTNGGSGINGIYQFDLSVNWNITTAVYNGVMVVAEVGADGYSGIKFAPGGTQMFVTQRNGADIIRYDLTQPWNIATATYVPPECDVAGQDTFIMGLAFNPDGSEMYVCGFANSIISKYTL